MGPLGAARNGDHLPPPGDRGAPLSAVLANGFGRGLEAFYRDVTSPVALSALKLTILVAVVTTVINALMGTLTAYALVRYDFPGRALLNGIVDLPFAIPTLVTGVMLVVLYGPQRMLGQWLTTHGVEVIFAPPGIVLAMLFVTYPFVVRTVQPVLYGAEIRQEEAAFSLGASKCESCCRPWLRRSCRDACSRSHGHWANSARS